MHILLINIHLNFKMSATRLHGGAILLLNLSLNLTYSKKRFQVGSGKKHCYSIDFQVSRVTLKLFQGTQQGQETCLGGILACFSAGWKGKAGPDHIQMVKEHVGRRGSKKGKPVLGFPASHRFKT